MKTFKQSDPFLFSRVTSQDINPELCINGQQKTMSLRKVVLSIFSFGLFIALMLMQGTVWGQTATVTFDYTGSTTTACNGDATYSGSSTSLAVPATGVPAGATITGISFTAHYGVLAGTTNVTFVLNGTNIGILSASNNTCVTGKPGQIHWQLQSQEEHFPVFTMVFLL